MLGLSNLVPLGCKPRRHFEQRIACPPISCRRCYRQGLLDHSIGELGPAISIGTVEIDLVVDCVESIWTSWNFS